MLSRMGLCIVTHALLLDITKVTECVYRAYAARTAKHCVWRRQWLMSCAPLPITTTSVS